jgi:hypothetical protein
MKKIIWKIFLVVITVCFTMSIGFAKKDDLKKVHKEIKFQGERKLTVKIDFGGGVIDLGKNNTGDILNADFEYNPDKFDMHIDYDKIEETGRLYLRSKSEEGHLDFDTDDNYWHLQFTDRVPIDFEIDVGACETEFDFTGLKINNLDLDLGASSTQIIFRKPNPEPIPEINIDVGASKLKIEGLGNANFDRLSFDGGVGDFTLDFSGELRGKAYVDINVGLGSLTILLPENIGVRIRKEGSFLSSFSIDEDEFQEVKSDVYESENFGRTEGELIFDIEIGLGLVEIEYIDHSL